MFFLKCEASFVFSFFFSSRRRHTRWTGDWSSDVCSSDLAGGVGEAVADGETGIIVDGRSPDETAAAIIRLLDDPVLARSMGTLGRDRVLGGFTWDDTVDQFRTALAKHAG